MIHVRLLLLAFFLTLPKGLDAQATEADIVNCWAHQMEPISRAEMVFIRGLEVPTRTRQRELFLRYRDLNRLPPG